jgi:ABC-type transport system involved in multi-copper enzyme maturation permease subunit
MYFWKCWRENRFLFIACLITLAAMGLFFTLILVKAGGRNVNPMLWKDIPQLWSSSTVFVLGVYGSMLTIFWALPLGSASLGGEFQKGTAEFLLSRPRRRWYWVWVGWSTGVCELAVAAFLVTGMTLGTLAWFTGYVFNWWILAAVKIGRAHV